MFFVQTAKNVVGRILVSDIFSAPKNLVLRTSVGFENPTYALCCFTGNKAMPSESFQTAFVRYSGMHKKVMRRVGWVDKPNVSDGPWAVWFLGAWASFVRTITLCFNKANRTYIC